MTSPPPGPTRPLGTSAGLAPCLMVQGTSSSAGKSLLVTGLCRHFARRGLRVAPFKAQNMALNSAATPDGLEIGRAQAVQAAAAGIPACVDMNPVLLKPEGHATAQVVVRGKPWARLAATEYHERKQVLSEVVAESLRRLRASFDVVLIEGAGSPAEINLRERDIANMHVAHLADAPVLLVGDIDRGGVFASFVGTLELLEPEDRARIRGLVINKFRGDPRLLEPGLAMLRERGGVAIAGVVPFLPRLRIADEDSVALDERVTEAPTEEALDICVARFPHISNHDDFQPLEHEPGVRLRYVEEATAARHADLLILPGTKATVADLAWMRDRGFAALVARRAARHAPTLAICGGAQMLGHAIEDPDGVESSSRHVEALGLMPFDTHFGRDKHTRPLSARLRTPCFLSDGEVLPGSLQGYEIHMGGLRAHDESTHRLLHLDAPRAAEGFVDAERGIAATLAHGLLDNDPLRHALLRNLRRRRGLPLEGAASAPFERDQDYERLADALEHGLSLPLVHALVGLQEER